MHRVMLKTIYIRSMKLIILFVCAINSNAAAGDLWYGILRGNKIVEYKSPVDGIISIDEIAPGNINEGKVLFSVKSVENQLKKELNGIKLRKAKEKLYAFKSDYNDTHKLFQRGFISRKDLVAYKEKVSDAEITIKELRNEELLLREVDAVSAPQINIPFIYHNVYVSDGSYIKTGDVIMQIETLDKYHIDIKIDPVASNLKDKKVIYRSMISGAKGYARVSGYFPSQQGDSMSGLKTIVLELEDSSSVSSDLLDTAFEVTVDD